METCRGTGTSSTLPFTHICVFGAMLYYGLMLCTCLFVFFHLEVHDDIVLGNELLRFSWILLLFVFSSCRSSSSPRWVRRCFASQTTHVTQWPSTSSRPHQKTTTKRLPPGMGHFARSSHNRNAMAFLLNFHFNDNNLIRPYCLIAP